MMMSVSGRRIARFRTEKAEEWAQLESTTEGGRDKRGTPVEPQAIEMTWVLACRSVGPRAAITDCASEFNTVCGTAASSRYEEAMR